MPRKMSKSVARPVEPIETEKLALISDSNVFIGFLDPAWPSCVHCPSVFCVICCWSTVDRATCSCALFVRFSFFLTDSLRELASRGLDAGPMWDSLPSPGSMLHG